MKKLKLVVLMLLLFCCVLVLADGPTPTPTPEPTPETVTAYWTKDSISSYSAQGRLCASLNTGTRLIGQAARLRQMKNHCTSNGHYFEFSSLQLDVPTTNPKPVTAEWVKVQVSSQTSDPYCSYAADAAVELLNRLMVRDLTYSIYCQENNSFLMFNFETLMPVEDKNAN